LKRDRQVRRAIVDQAFRVTIRPLQEAVQLSHGGLVLGCLLLDYRIADLGRHMHSFDDSDQRTGYPTSDSTTRLATGLSGVRAFPPGESKNRDSPHEAIHATPRPGSRSGFPSRSLLWLH